MPFHIDHDGPAPISTYFLVDAGKEDVAKPPPPASAEDVEMEQAVESTDTNVPSEAAEPPADSSLARHVTDATTRFVATFRGRTMQGLKVDLPCDYSGIIMAGEGAPAPGRVGALKSKIQRVVKAKRGSRVTRRATRDEEELDGDEEPENGQNSRTLIPTTQFSSFVLWHPDIPVDPGRDEYLRSLTEWIRLADEVDSHFFLAIFRSHPLLRSIVLRSNTFITLVTSDV